MQIFDPVAVALPFVCLQIFGPVAVAIPFRTAKEAIELGNNTIYGLGASVWTENVSLSLEVALSLKAGTVWVNAHNLFDAAAGFGGYRQSGFGRDGGKEVSQFFACLLRCFCREPCNSFSGYELAASCWSFGLNNLTVLYLGTCWSCLYS